jgi:SAM-dependent methyltransferase
VRSLSVRLATIDEIEEIEVSTYIGALHDNLVLGRRVKVLADHLSGLTPTGARLLDVGCGDGNIDVLLMQKRPDIHIEGIDVLLRPSSRIPVRFFDGAQIPYPDASFDVAMFVDVLHHTEDPLVLLKEAARVARNIVIKDHLREGFLSNTTLRFMDWVGNAHHGVVLPYNYWSRARWEGAFSQLDLSVAEIKCSLGLYPGPAHWFFDRGLHFVARLECHHAR